MSAYESSYKSQLQGVSQQIARERLDGQVTAQENMLSDAVTNIRRRPGAGYAYNLTFAGATEDRMAAWPAELRGLSVQVLLNSVDGVVKVLDSANAVLATLTSPYLITTNPERIQTAVVGDELFMLNPGTTPALAGSSGINPDLGGFFYVKSGAFSKTYSARVSTTIGSMTATYTTPNGTTAGDAALSTPEYIAGQLATQITAAFGTVATTVTREASYVFLGTVSPNLLQVSTDSGDAYMVASGKAYIRQEANLPSRLPSIANGFVIAVGDVRALRYYTYASASMSWLESGAYASPTSITSMPVALSKVTGSWAIAAGTFEGRTAGDEDSNPAPEFIKYGITGMGAWQGRLVLLAGPMVCLSASGKPRRFYRSTVTSLLDSDTISVGSSGATSAAFQYAIPFAKDLLLFSAGYQALIPGGTQAITPRTASVVVTSTYEADMTSRPIPAGVSLMYPVPRSADFFGLMEMYPSTTAENQYVSSDSTAHLPKYLAGRCRGGVSSSVGNLVVFMPTGDRYALLVHEYLWQGDKKVQQAWHKWSFPYKVATAYFYGQLLHVMFVKNGVVLGCTIDPRAGSTTSLGEQRPFLDLSVFVDVVGRAVAYPTWLTSFDPAAVSTVRLSVATGALAGEPVGATPDGLGGLTTVPSFPAGRVALGFPYLSLLSPTAPLRKDYNGVVITSNKLTVLRFMVSTNGSAEYDVSIADAAQSPEQFETGTLYYSSGELELGQARNGADSTAVVPARTNAASTSLVISTGGTGELNVVGIEFVARTHDKIKRR